jgi:quinohemoprotein amine dehydrogenase beta subunit
MKQSMIGGALRRTAAAVACLAAGVLPAAAANEALALKAGSEYLMVANYPNNLNVVDLASASVYKTCKLPDAFGPGITQISPDRRTAYILNNRFGTIYGVDLDTCKLNFRAEMSQGANERAKSIGSISVSADGKELYAVQNPTIIERDHYRVGAPRLVVYDTAAGLDAKPIRSFPAPRQITMLQAADDGALYMAGANLYKADVNTGTMTTALPIRDWQRPTHAPIDVLSIWPVQTPSRDFTILYTTAKFQDEKQDPASAEYQYGFLNVNLQSGETEAREFGPLTEL